LGDQIVLFSRSLPVAPMLFCRWMPFLSEKQCVASAAGNLSFNIESVNLEDKVGDRVKTLSGGMLRRAGIAQAILGDSKVMLLDEPTAGLDPSERVRFKNTISCLKQDKMILISTHIVEDVDAVVIVSSLLTRGKYCSTDLVLN
ncbi:MAG: ATP-binding cassette domain-containing protein, partial [Bacillota bacterium]|nr:ATP-binding cassette domain-containing protein [Bacillota bacterium]